MKKIFFLQKYKIHINNCLYDISLHFWNCFMHENWWGVLGELDLFSNNLSTVRIEGVRKNKNSHSNVEL